MLELVGQWPGRYNPLLVVATVFQHNPILVHLEVNPIILSGAYSQESVFWIAVLELHRAQLPGHLLFYPAPGLPLPKILCRTTAINAGHIRRGFILI